MPINRPLRLLLGLGITVALLVILAMMLFVTEAALSVWDQLKDVPSWVFYGYVAAILLIGGGGGWAVWRLLIPRKRKDNGSTYTPPKEAEITARLEKAAKAGIDIDAAVDELEDLKQRRATGQVHVAFFGNISTGKSALIRALVPSADVVISARGGTTRTVNRYIWRTAAGDELIVSDIPGSNEVGRQLDELSREEALRAHIVVYVCDGDLTRTQMQELQMLLSLTKPTIVAFNKADLYSQSALDQIRQRLHQHLDHAMEAEIVAISAGGTEEIVRVYPDGREETSSRERPPRVEPLKLALQRQIDDQLDTLEALRDSAVFVLVAHKLDQAKSTYQQHEADKIIRRQTQKAIVAALATVSPGTDIVVQGYLGASMVKALCDNYEAAVRKLDIERFLELAQLRLSKTLPLILAVAGNGLKAFPGVGTVAGGLIHAVAYGLIFDALGRTVKHTLESRGEFRPAPAVVLFGENLSENLDTRARRFVELALSATRNKENAS